MKKIHAALMGMSFIILSLSFSVSAQSDSLGIVGEKLAGKVGIEVYTSIVMVLGSIVYRLLQFACERTKSTWYWNDTTKKYSVGLFMRVLSWFFGKNINSSNVEYSENTYTTKAESALKDYLKKKYKLLQIDIKR